MSPPFGYYMTVISFPVPPYSNFPIEPQNFQPSRFVISAVSLGITTTVTTITNMNYVIGQLVRLLIPESFGCYQLNNLTGYVITLPSANQVQIQLDSSKNVNAFTSSTATTLPQIVAVGGINQGITSTTGVQMPSTAIPGSFENISPQP